MKDNEYKTVLTFTVLRESFVQPFKVLKSNEQLIFTDLVFKQRSENKDLFFKQRSNKIQLQHLNKETNYYYFSASRLTVLPQVQRSETWNAFCNEMGRNYSLEWFYQFRVAVNTIYCICIHDNYFVTQDHGEVQLRKNPIWTLEYVTLAIFSDSHVTRMCIQIYRQITPTNTTVFLKCLTIKNSKKCLIWQFSQESRIKLLSKVPQVKIMLIFKLSFNYMYFSL